MPLDRRGGAAPAFPESELARVKATRLRELAIARSQPQTTGVRSDSRRWCTAIIRMAASILPRRCSGLHASSRCALLLGQLRRGARCICTCRACSTGAGCGERRSDGTSAIGTRSGSAQRRAPAPPRARAVALIDRPGRCAVDDHARPAHARSSRHQLHAARRHRRAARWDLRLAHHDEHSRAKGLHVLAVQLPQRATAWRILGGTG